MPSRLAPVYVEKLLALCLEILHIVRMSYSSQLEAVLKKAGGPSALARALGVTPSAVTQWRDVPAKHVYRTATITGIPVQEIRPDLVGPPVKADAA